jgi:hypothetical protein
MKLRRAYRAPIFPFLKKWGRFCHFSLKKHKMTAGGRIFMKLKFWTTTGVLQFEKDAVFQISSF